MQSRFAIRGWLGVVACVIVLGVGAVFVHRTGMANRDEAPSAAADATPKVDGPAVTSSISGVASSDAAITAEAQREASWREAREATIRVQQRLRTEQQARKAAQRQQEEAKNERCVDGQRMKRVENGWVQAGNC